MGIWRSTASWPTRPTFCGEASPELLSKSRLLLGSSACAPTEHWPRVWKKICDPRWSAWCLDHATCGGLGLPEQGGAHFNLLRLNRGHLWYRLSTYIHMLFLLGKGQPVHVSFEVTSLQKQTSFVVLQACLICNTLSLTFGETRQRL